MFLVDALTDSASSQRKKFTPCKCKFKEPKTELTSELSGPKQTKILKQNANTFRKQSFVKIFEINPECSKQAKNHNSEKIG